LDNLVLKESVFSLSTAQAMTSQTEQTLSQLSNQTLAGIFILLYSSKDLITYRVSPVIINDMLSTSKQTTLIRAIQVFSKITKHNVNSVPQRDLDPHTYANSNEQTFEDYLKDFVELVEDAVKIKSDENPVNSAMVRLRGSWTPPVMQKNQIPSWTKSDHEIQFARDYHQARVSAKQALARSKFALIQLGYTKLVNVLGTATAGDSLLTATIEIKDKLHNRLADIYADIPESFQSQIDIIMNFISMSKDKDIDATKRLSLNLDNASSSFVSDKPRLTLAERLAKARNEVQS
jgi:hypothetical protein